MATVVVDGIEYEGKFIGQGKFSKVYRVGNRVVYYTKNDCAKEVLGYSDVRMMHLPELIRHENVIVYDIKKGEIKDVYNVYSAPYYKNVTRKDESAWLLMNAIIDFYFEYYMRNKDIVRSHSGMTNIEKMEGFVDYIRGKVIIPRSIVNALAYLVNRIRDCGEDAMFDFHSGNFGINEYGVLILRDVVAIINK